MPLSLCRTVPQATTTSKEELRAQMEATLMLLVTTRRFLCSSRARAAFFVVVPILMHTETPSGMCVANRAPMRRFSSWQMPLRSS